MRILLQLSSIALRQVLGEGSQGIVQALADRFGDRSSRLIEALLSANQQAWKAIEIALAGTSWWDRCKLALSSGEQFAFREQVKAFLQASPLTNLPGDPEQFRRQCLTELKAARKAGLLPGEDLSDRATLRRQAQDLARFRDPHAVMEAEFKSVCEAGEELKAHGHTNLARFVSLRPGDGQPLLIVAVQYFFRRTVEADPRLSAELQFHEVTKLSKQQETGFQNLHTALTQQGERLESLLENALELLEETRDLARESRDVGKATHDEVSALRAEMTRQSEEARQMYQAVLDLLARQQAAIPPPTPTVVAVSITAPTALPATPPPVPPAIPSEDVVAEMRSLVEQCDTLPTEEKRQHRALFRAVGRLKATVKAHESQSRLRKNVLPSALFTAGPSPVVEAPAEPPPPPRKLTARPLLGAAFAIETTDEPPKAAPPPAPDNPPPDSPPPGTTKSIFGNLPKPKIRRKPEE